MEFYHDILENLLDKLIDYRGKTPKKTLTGVPLVTAKIVKNGTINGYTEYIAEEDYDKWMVRGFPKVGDVILTTEAPLGEVAQLKEEKVALAQRIVCLRGKDNVLDNTYLKYYLQSGKGQKSLSARESGTTVTGIKQAELRRVDIEYPAYDDQRRIASILSSLDRKIELNNKINADLEEMAQAIFKNWLSECSDDVTIGELSLNITNYEKTDAEEVVLINSSDVTEGYFDHHNYSPNKNLKGHFKKRFQKGDILYSQVRPRNRHWAYCNFDANDYLASTQLMVIRNNPSLITSILLYQYIISDNVWKEFTLKTETRSGTFPQGNYEDLSQIRVPYNSDVEGISNQLETLYAKMFILEKENSRLSLLRDTLLPRLMSGELEVSE